MNVGVAVKAVLQVLGTIALILLGVAGLIWFMFWNPMAFMFVVMGLVLLAGIVVFSQEVYNDKMSDLHRKKAMKERNEYRIKERQKFDKLAEEIDRLTKRAPNGPRDK